MMNINKLRELASKATPGPWEAFTDCPGECCWLVREVDREMAGISDTTFPSELITAPEMSREDAAYIAAASPDVLLALLDVAEKAQEMVKALKESRLIELEGTPMAAVTYSFVRDSAALRTSLAALGEQGK